VGGADEDGRRDPESGQDRRDVGEIDGKHVVVGIAIVLGPAMAAIIERHDEPRRGRVGGKRRRQAMKVGGSPGETGEAHDRKRRCRP
jgi:hypothetical protein